MAANCATCPFRPKAEGGWEEVRELLTQRALSEASPICHSTGPGALKRPQSGRFTPARICRGARNFQLEIFARLGWIEAPTDEAWAAKCQELGLE